jgi:opacity protein-like surface antigen
VKHLFILFFLFLLFHNSNAQNELNTITSKNTSDIMIGHGIGNIWKSFLKKGINIPNYKISSIGPVNIIYEHGITKRISSGLSFTYSNIKGSYNNGGFFFKDNLMIITVLGRFNYHFKLNKKFDTYIGCGLGYVYSKYSNSINTSTNNVPGEFGYSAQLGIKYYFVNGLGLYSEVGYVNGSFIQAGLCCTF